MKSQVISHLLVDQIQDRCWYLTIEYGFIFTNNIWKREDFDFSLDERLDRELSLSLKTKLEN
jgi:hypothetical protein